MCHWKFLDKRHICFFLKRTVVEYKFRNYVFFLLCFDWTVLFVLLVWKEIYEERELPANSGNIKILVLGVNSFILVGCSRVKGCTF